MSETTDPTVPVTVTPTVEPPAAPAVEADDGPALPESFAGALANLGNEQTDIPDEPGEAPAAEEPGATEAPAEEVPASEPADEAPVEEPVAEAEPVVEPTPATPPVVVDTTPTTKVPTPDEIAAAQQARQQAVQEQQAHRQRTAKYEADLAAFEAKTSADGYEFDPFVDGKEASRLNVEGAKLLRIEQQRIEQATAVIQQQEQVRQFWGDYAAKNADVPVKKAQEAWDRLLQTAQAEYGHLNEQAVGAVADAQFKHWEKTYKAQVAAKPRSAAPAPRTPTPAPAAKPRPAAVAPKVTPGGARVTPAAQGNARPVAPTNDPLDDFARKTGKGVLSFLD